MTLLILAFFLIPSVCLNTFLIFRLRKKPKRGPLSYDARRIIHDLTADGFTMVALSQDGEARHVDTNDILLRSNKK